MKNLIVLSLLIAFTAVTAMAQGGDVSLTKQEKKEWKKAAKNLTKNPGQLKVLMEENANYGRENDQLQQEAERLRAASNQKERQLVELEQQVSNLTRQLRDAEDALAARPQEPQRPLDTDAIVMGVVYKVQIGAYEKRRLEGDLADSQNLTVEEKNSLQKVAVGQFRDYGKAKELRDQLRAMGVKDAWVVSYRDGVRVPIEDVLPAGQKQ